MRSTHVMDGRSTVVSCWRSLLAHVSRTRHSFRRSRQRLAGMRTTLVVCAQRVRHLHLPGAANVGLAFSPLRAPRQERVSSEFGFCELQIGISVPRCAHRLMSHDVDK